MRHRRLPAASLAVALLLLATSPLARAQGHGGAGGPGGPGGSPGQSGPGGPGGGGGGLDGAPPPDASGMPGGGGRFGGPPGDAGRGGHNSPLDNLRIGLHVGPPGRWWDDKHFAHDLGLKSDQQKRLDAVFNENRGNLTSRFQALQDEDATFRKLAKSANPDEAALFAEIDRLAQAHASLEKAFTHYLLSIRAELTADQLARLDSPDAR